MPSQAPLCISGVNFDHYISLRREFLPPASPVHRDLEQGGLGVDAGGNRALLHIGTDARLVQAATDVALGSLMPLERHAQRWRWEVMKLGDGGIGDGGGGFPSLPVQVRSHRAAFIRTPESSSGLPLPSSSAASGRGSAAGLATPPPLSPAGR
ncbi:hypothetical protein C2845_PM03G02070 [Panicum miliaceum]|uniref:Uncharacterized protein n=1 Tax=Panicum miliaceum TaxID=4540 RepID=A0A3L6T4X4_PANMI|nr:hypothetical protein C2845_PM03G02070 [Panicum miliaceum]